MTGHRTRLPVAMAGLALVAVTAVSCGDDTGDGTAAADPGTSSTSTSPPATAPPSETASPSQSVPPGLSQSAPSPIIDKAAKAALKARFPALVTMEVPIAYTVVDAAFDPSGGGRWTIHITDQNGDPITLVQTTDNVEDLVAATIGPGAHKSGSVDLKAFGLGVWQQYEGGSQLAIARSLSDTSVVVTGSTQSQAVSIAKTLLTAEDGGNPDGG